MNGSIKKVFIVKASDGYDDANLAAFHDYQTASGFIAGLNPNARPYYRISDHYAFVDTENKIYLIQDTGLILDETASQKLKRQALAKLTQDEKEILGLV